MAKVKEVDTNQVRNEDKAKDKPKKSKSEKPGRKKTGVKHTKFHALDSLPNGRVEEGVPDREAIINEPPEQSQIDRKRRHMSASQSEPFEAIDSNFAKLASHIQLAHEAVGKTATKAYIKHLRRSINSGTTAALTDAHFIGMS